MSVAQAFASSTRVSDMNMPRYTLDSPWLRVTPLAFTPVVPLVCHARMPAGQRVLNIGAAVTGEAIARFHAAPGATD
jgi:hypothetical protein